MKSLISKIKNLTASDKRRRGLSRPTKQAQQTQGATGIISLRDFKLKALPERLQEAPTARVIDAASNQLTKLPPWIGAFGGTLTRLVLSSNLLQSLPAEVGQLQQLRTLLIDNNRITALPSELKLPRLELLDVGHNNLETFPAKISSLTSLRELRASHNHLGVLTPQLGSCSALQHADFAGNALKVLPVDLSKLRKLQLLNVDNNAISAVPPAILSGCTLLQTLSLHGCPITIRELEATQGYAEFEQRRRQRFDKIIASNSMLPVGGMQESASRA